MKTLRLLGLTLALLLLPFGGRAADTLITLTITVTNTPSAGNTLTVNGATRTWRASPTMPSTEIELGTNTSSTANSLYNHASRYPYTGPLQTGLVGTNQVTLRAQVNQALVASLVGSWATLSYATNNVTNAVAVRIPVSIESAGTRGRIGDGLVAAINDYANTNTFNASAPALVNFVDTSESQTISGNKTFLSATRFASIQTTGLVNRGSALSSPGSGVGAEQFGSGSTATGTNALAFGNTATTAYLRGLAVGYTASAGAQDAIGLGYAAAGGSSGSGAGSIAIGSSAATSGDRALALGSGALAAGADSVVVGPVASDAGFTNAVAIGRAATNTAANQIRLGTAAHTISIPGTLSPATITGATISGTIGTLTGGTVASTSLTSPSVSDATLTGTTVINGRTRLVHATLSSLANGANSGVNVGDYSFVRLTAGPSAAFSIAGLAGGATGRWLTIYNATGQDMTMANESGTETTATNRITTCTGADLTITGAGCVQLLYDGTAARWIVVAYESPALTASSFVDLSSAQTITGSKIFASITTTNAVNYGNALSSPGAGSSSEQFGSGASASGADATAIGNTAGSGYTGGTAVGYAAGGNADYTVAVGYSATASEINAVAIGKNSAASQGSAIAIGNTATASDIAAVALGRDAAAGGTSAVALGNSTSAGFARSMALGYSSTAAAADEIALGMSDHNTVIRGSLDTRKKFVTPPRDVTGLSSGTNSAVNIASGRVFAIRTGPVAAYTISGLANGVDGMEVDLFNLTGQNLTLMHDNAAESTAANRITTMTGADLTSTGNASAHLIYDGTTSRWLVLGWQP